MCFHGLFHVLQFPDYDQCLLGVFQNLGWPSFGFKRQGFQPFELDMIHDWERVGSTYLAHSIRG